MNEAQTRKDLIDKAIEAAGWTAANGCQVLVEQSACEFAPGHDGEGAVATPRTPRILFLTDRNILANQGLIDFSGFADDALARVTPKEIHKRDDKVPKNATVFFTIYDTFMLGEKGKEFYRQYDSEYGNSYLLVAEFKAVLRRKKELSFA